MQSLLACQLVGRVNYKAWLRTTRLSVNSNNDLVLYVDDVLGPTVLMLNNDSYTKQINTFWYLRTCNALSIVMNKSEYNLDPSCMVLACVHNFALTHIYNYNTYCKLSHELIILSALLVV